jgi:uroporphyrinogen decarboxylase
VEVLKGRSGSRMPFWFMRQAGRYLPEYRALREKAGSFLDLCLTPALAAEATLQPVRRFGMDAAILFSDILTVPYGLGQAVRFEDGTGPILSAIDGADDIARLNRRQVGPRLTPVYEAVRQVRARLPKDVALIGFAGAPWTVASYMIEGGTSRDFSRVKQLAYAAPALFERLVALLVETTAAHLVAQARAGAQVLQLFDSWVGVLPERQARQWGLEPSRQIVALVKEAVPEVPVILFPRGAGLLYEAYARDSGADAVSLDTTVPLGWARATLQPHAVVQGNLDSVLLAVGGEPMRAAAEEILDALGAGRFVFNLGHGILPQTPPENLAALCELLRSWKR